jgi:hypothetical protein
MKEIDLTFSRDFKISEEDNKLLKEITQRLGAIDIK